MSRYVAAALDGSVPLRNATFQKAHGVDWDPSSVGVLSKQAVFVGIYDGLVCSGASTFSFDLIKDRHGGSGVAQYLRQELHGLVESVNKSMIPELYAWTQELGGYFKRFKGGVLAPWINGGESEPLDLEARMTLAFFDVRIRQTNPESSLPGSCIQSRLIGICPLIVWPKVAEPLHL